MITVVSTPAADRVLLDANNTVITLTSSNGAGFYFRALIYVDDVLFDTQGWSRRDAFTASKDLVKLYNAYFENPFIETTGNTFTEVTALKKKISITIEERDLATDAIAQTAILPVFYFMYNTNPVYFDDSVKVQLLSQPAVLQIPANGKIKLPIYAKAVNEAVVVTTKSNFGTILNTQTFAAYTGKKTLLYTFNLSGVNLVRNTIYFETTITCGPTAITLRYRLLLLPDFPVKEIYFKNNFGYYLPAYFDGELEIQNSFKINDYQQADGSNVVFEITEDADYTINTGSLLQDERVVVSQITKSLDVLFKINNTWKRIQNATKKELEYKDRLHVYSTDLRFSFAKSDKVPNL